MKQRYIYVILFGIPGFLVSLLITIMFFGFLAGFLWLYIFGDETWPAYIENMLPVLFVITFLILWTASITYGYFTGKRLEDSSEVDRKHIITSIVVLILSLSIILLYQARIGNIGSKPVTLLCSEYCLSQGFVMSSMPPRDSGEMTCSCFDEFGQETMNIQVDDIIP